MSRNLNREESYRIAAEKMRLKKEKEEREDNEYYERITSGTPWLIFKAVVVFCALMLVISTFDYFVDGPTKKLSAKSWKIDRSWEYTWHRVLDVEGCMFTPTLGDWMDRIESSTKITYSPIFRTVKKISFYSKTRNRVKKVVEIRQRSIFTWFPAFQLFLMIPIFTYFFKRKAPWFSFARLISLAFVLPGTLFVIYFTLL